MPQFPFSERNPESSCSRWSGDGYIEAVNPESNVTKYDVFSAMPGLVSLIIVAFLNCACQLPGSISFLLIPLSLLGYAVGSVAVLAVTVYLAINKRPKRGASVLLILLLPALRWLPITWGADFVHLGLTAGFEAGYLGDPIKLNDHNFIAYDWSVGLAGGPNTFLIHDVTDEIALPMDRHTKPSNSKNDVENECAGRVRRMVSHYYVCTF